ncbi:hypothetical protein CLU83_3515 [Flavobacterium sp. 1]|uniref:hypothetical protein n=1 Tax=Flavobacterium sp. 1 TaxID=2035200 RepID=UPI000C234890|nr:hypothetical protein [Flavobacterium sp. 1]PJJ10124.1 hypothetical protein CLU83_3515 [Flavobacterium sp. 1]
MAKISFNYEKPFNKLLDKLQILLKNEDGYLTGDESSGSFQIKSAIGTFKGKYKYLNKVITVEIEKKPFFISSKIIESEVKKYLFSN